MPKPQIRPVPVAKKNALLRFALAAQVTLLKRNWMGSMGGMVMVVHHKGRKTGRDFATPVAYLREGDDLLCVTNGEVPSNWSLNALAADDVALNIQGQTTHMHARKLTSPDEIAAAFAKYHSEYGFFERAFFCDRDAPVELLHQARDRMTFLRFCPADEPTDDAIDATPTSETRQADVHVAQATR